MDLAKWEAELAAFHATSVGNNSMAGAGSVSTDQNSTIASMRANTTSSSPDAPTKSISRYWLKHLPLRLLDTALPQPSTELKSLSFSLYAPPLPSSAGDIAKLQALNQLVRRILRYKWSMALGQPSMKLGRVWDAAISTEMRALKAREKLKLLVEDLERLTEPMADEIIVYLSKVRTLVAHNSKKAKMS